MDFEHGRFTRGGIIPKAKSPRTGVVFPYSRTIEDERNKSIYTIENKEQLDKLIDDFFSLLDVVEESAQFDAGLSGENARRVLRDIGVWSKE